MKKTLAIMLALIMAVCLLPTIAFAEGNTITVGSTGANYATLADAVAAAQSGDTIVLTSNLTMTKCARFYDKDLTIDGQGHTVTRDEENFSQQQDDARGTYNPAMIEVQGNNKEGAECGLTLKNIILDDAGRHKGTVFAQASSGAGHGDNTVYVQDAMIASNATVPCTITLGEGAVLRNFGGMSAVRVTDRAKLVMESGSKIEDTTVTDRVKGPSDSVGPAGAVWIQGAAFEMEDGAEISNINFEMEDGAEISNINGRAVYVDGGNVTVGGTISNITGNANMWQGTHGTAIHLRNSATGTLTETGLIENVTGNDVVYLNSSAYAMEDGSIINNHANKSADPKTHGIYSVDSKADQRNEVRINGEICGINGNPFQIANTNVYIGETGNIHNNFVYYGALYLQKNATADIYGKINNNTAGGRGGGIGTAGHGFVEINIYTGAEIKNNTAADTGGGASLKFCKFTMYGGEISDNNGKTGGGIYLYSDASADILGGTITNNTANSVSNDLAVTSKNCGTKSIYLYISDKSLIGNPAVYMEQNTKTVSPGDRNIKIHNASGDSINALSIAAIAKGWYAPLATFWTQRDDAASLTVGGLAALNKNLPVYVLTQKTGADGKPASSDAPVHTYAATVDVNGNVKFTLPSGDMNGDGCAVAIVQPTEDFGNVVITGPAEIEKNSSVTPYEIPYTATYTMSQGFKTMLNSNLDGATSDIKLRFVVELDNRLTAKKDAEGKFIYEFDGAGVLEPIDNEIVVSDDGHTITVPCKLKNGWQTAILKEKIVMTLDGTGVLQAGDFNPGGVLGTTGNIQAQLQINQEVINVLIPANVCQTKMVGEETMKYTVTYKDGVSGTVFKDQIYEDLNYGDSTPFFNGTPSRSGYTFTGWSPAVAYTVTGDATYTAQWSENGGSHTHPHPDPIPVPEIVIPPKTGDMTIWQSILSFLGIK